MRTCELHGLRTWDLAGVARAVSRALRRPLFLHASSFGHFFSCHPSWLGNWFDFHVHGEVDIRLNQDPEEEGFMEPDLREFRVLVHVTSAGPPGQIEGVLRRAVPGLVMLRRTVHEIDPMAVALGSGACLAPRGAWESFRFQSPG
jgi:hypothetical protein